MSAITSDKTNTIEKINQIIKQRGGDYTKWKIGLSSIQRLTYLSVKEEVHYFPQEAMVANEIIFNFIAQGTQVCKMSKLHSDGIYLYR